MATKSFTTTHQFDKTSAMNLLKAFEKAEKVDNNVLASPNKVNYIKRGNAVQFKDFLANTVKK